jgi:phosphoribosyl 1,2-cyclic phosphodiesterase
VRVACLGSGSDGNATLVCHGSTALLVDCGFAPSDVARRMRSLGVAPTDLAGILVTHEHTDHSRGLAAFAHRHGVPVLLSRGTAAALGWSRPRSGISAGPRCQIVRAGEPLWVGEVGVLPLIASHDAREPLGFRLDSADGGSLGYLTDTGVVESGTRDALRECRVLALEANHCPDLLLAGPYPAFLKRRIRSEHGHLSNQQAAAVLSEVAGPGLQAVLAMHLSKVNNRPGLAVRALAQGLAAAGVRPPVIPQVPGSAAWLEVDEARR